jgi:hydroxymethylpyrimidine pyrophosphatase-like HAD family hydrolase
MDDPDVLDRVMPHLEKFSKKLQVIRSNAHQIEITDFASTKASALCYLAKNFNIDMANTYSVGDGGNDASMIKEAGIGFAVANSEPILKEVAKVVLPYSNEQDAVRRIIEEYLNK